MPIYIKGTDREIQGIVEVLETVASVCDLDAEGNPVYNGNARIDWYAQKPKPKLNDKGSRIWVDEDGRVYSDSEIEQRPEPGHERDRFLGYALSAINAAHRVHTEATSLCLDETEEDEGFDNHPADAVRTAAGAFSDALREAVETMGLGKVHFLRELGIYTVVLPPETETGA